MNILRLSPSLAFLLFIFPFSFLRGDTQVLKEPLFRGLRIPEAIVGDALGSSAAGIGDFNGDGVGDFALGGTPLSRPSSVVYLVMGRMEFHAGFDLKSAPGVVKIASQHQSFGTDVYRAGDLDGDGLSDVYIYQPQRLYLVYGSRDFPDIVDKDEIGTSIRGMVLTGSSLPALIFQNPIGPLSDFNGDGAADLAIGQSDSIGPLDEHGQVTILYSVGSLEGVFDLDSLIAAGRGVRILGSVFSDKIFGLGTALVPAGDVNGDKLSDFLVVDPKLKDAFGNVMGRIYLIYGSRDFPVLTHAEDLGSRTTVVELQGELTADAFQPFPVLLGGGDLDGDGFSDFGFRLSEKVGLRTRGRLLFVRGAPDLPASIPVGSIEDGSLGFQVEPLTLEGQVQFGLAAVMAPDENGDGHPEILVSRDGSKREALVIQGGIPIPQAKIEAPLHIFQGSDDQLDAQFLGGIVASAGDVNGDGVPDYLLPAPERFGEPGDAQGSVYLLFGGFESKVLSLTSASPSQATVAEAVEVMISGTGFVSGLRVFFGAKEALPVQLVDPHTLSVKTPVFDSPQAVDLKVVLPDARTAILPLGFTFTDKVRRLSAGDIEGLVTFQAPDPQDTNRIHPRVLGDVNGDRIDDYLLRTYNLGSAYLIYGGTKWKGVVTSQELEEKAVRFHYRDGSRTTPELFPLGDLNGEGKADYAVCKAVIPETENAEFVVVFDALQVGTEMAFEDLRRDPSVAFFSSSQALGYEVRPVGDFDGDGAADLLTYSVSSFDKGIPQIVVVYGPFSRGERVDLDDVANERSLWIHDSLNANIFGQGVAPVGDFNGDGRGDIGFYNNQAAGCCALHVVFGQPRSTAQMDFRDMLRDGRALALPYNSPIDLLDSFLSRAGDLDGDGFEDLLLSGFTFPDGRKGIVGLLRGAEGFAEGASWKSEVSGLGGFLIHGADPGGYFGYDSLLRDIDKDGRPDIVAGSFYVPETVGAQAKPGLVHIIHDVGSLRGEHSVSELENAVTVIEGRAPGDRFGFTVQVLGDQDGDGLPELLVEAPFTDITRPDIPTLGRTYLIPGGSLPAKAKEVFLRGDTQPEGLLNITDAIRILGALFLGAAPLDCEKSGDADDDGALNITDAIYLLRYLFLGGPPPPAPYPEPGPDPTPDSLRCRSPAV